MSKEEISMEEQPLCSHVINEIPVKFEPIIQEKYKYSEEEEKAIEDLNEMIKKSRNLREEEFYKLIGVHNIQAISTVLNLIEKQQKQIENSVSKDKIEKLEKKYARRCAILHRNATADQWYSMGKNIGRTEAYQELLEGVDSI